MNPEVNLKTFQRGGHEPPRGMAPRPLVSPPRRMITRFVIPIVLFAAFAGVFVYATRDALVSAIEVEVTQPILPSGGVRRGGGDLQDSEAGKSATVLPSPVQEKSLGTSGGQPLFQAPGWIEPDPFTTLVSSLIPGTLSEVYVREGESVCAGAVVAELDSTDARIALQKAEATLAVRRAEAEAAQQNWDYPITLNQTLQMARAEKARLEAEKVKNQRQFEFQSKLADISRQLGRSGADSVLAAEKATLEASVAEATVKEIDAKILAQDAALDAATSSVALRIEDKSRLALAQAQLQEAIATLEEARTALQRCKVKAPTTGTVMKLHKTPGAMVSSDVPEGTQIVSMYDPASLQVRAEVPLAEAGKILIGLPAEIKVEAMPDRVFHGELTRIVHQADVQRNSLQVKVRILDPVPTLKPEMVARVQFKSMSKPAEITASHPAEATPKQFPASTEIPVWKASESVADSGSNTGGLLLEPAALPPNASKGNVDIWLVGTDLRAHRKTIILSGKTQGDLHEVSAGLQPSDKIIISNQDKLKDGSRVRIKPRVAEKASHT